MIIPLAHEHTTVRNMPWVSFTVIALCLMAFPSTWLDENQALAEERFFAVIQYYSERPYLELDPRVLPPEVTERWLGEYGGEAPADRKISQKKLDELTAEWLAAREELALWRHGLVPAHTTWWTRFTHMFLHSGWLHLIGNLLFFYLSGPFVEDVWGKPLFAGFYLLAGLFAGSMFALHYPTLEAPLIGASGPIAGVMGAFLILFSKVKIRFLWMGPFWFKTFNAPAWLMLPLWFVMQVGAAFVLDRQDPTGSTGGVAYWAHVWGFVFGLVVATGLRLRGLDGRDEAKLPRAPGTASAALPRPEPDEALHQALIAEGQGEFSEALRLFAEASQRFPTHLRLAATYWRVARRRHREEEAVPGAWHLIREQLRRGHLDSALQQWRELHRAVPRAVPEVGLLLRLTEDLFARRRDGDAREILALLIEQLGPAVPVDEVTRLIRLIGQMPSDLRQQCIRRLLSHPQLPAADREELEAQIILG